MGIDFSTGDEDVFFDIIFKNEYSFKREMTLNTKKFFYNKTRLYLVPLLKDYGVYAWSKISALPIIAWGISDFKYQARKERCFTNHVFALVDTVNDDYLFSSVSNISWLKNQHFVEDIYDFELEGQILKMIVFKLNDKHRYSVDAMLNNKYKEIYTDFNFYLNDTINFAGKSFYNPVYGVVTKSSKQRALFIEAVRERFGVHLPDSEIKGYDFPTIKEQEIFNFKTDTNGFQDFIFNECKFVRR